MSNVNSETESVPVTTHTPGPWKLLENGPQLTHESEPYRIIHTPRFWLDLIAPAGLDQDEHEANARLIAAAPDLYDALREVSMLIESGLFKHYQNEPWIDRVRAAIAKAEGRS